MSMARGVTTCNIGDQEKMKIATRIATIHRLIVKRKKGREESAKQANAQFDAKSHTKIAESIKCHWSWISGPWMG